MSSCPSYFFPFVLPHFTMQRNLTGFLLLLCSIAVLAFSPGCGGQDYDTSLLQRQSGHPVLLVRGPTPASEDQLWMEALDQTLGGCDVLSANSLAPGAIAQALQGRALVIFSHSALASLDTLAAQRMESFFEEGGIALLDTPDGAWAANAGLRAMGTRIETTLPWPRLRPTFGPLLRGGEPGQEQETRPSPPLTALRLRHERWIHRPAVSGVRVRLSPFGRPAVWWTPHSGEAWITESLSLPSLLEGIRRQKTLTHEQRERWQEAVEEALLDPAAFPFPWPRIWPTPFAENAPALDNGSWDLLRRSVHLRPRWLSENQLEIALRLEEVQAPGTEESAFTSQLAIAVPVRWHGRVLADWHVSWDSPHGRRAVAFQRPWQLVALNEKEGRLILDYRPTNEARRWH